MVPRTRRRTLQGAAALLGALAGCSSTSTGSGRSSGPSTAENVDRDPDHYILRNPRDGPAAWLRPADAGPREGASATPDPDGHHTVSGLVADRETAARIAFPDVPGRDEARQFVEETDFDRETLVLEPDRVGECFRLELCFVTWSATEYHTYAARHYRDVDVSCRADAHDGISWLIRIPDTLDPDEVHSRGSGTTSGTCANWEHRLERRRAEADGPNRNRTGDSPDATATTDHASIGTVTGGSR